MRNSRLPIRAWTVRAYLRSPIKPRAGQMLVVARTDDGSTNVGPR
jgi:hypothetical protein